MEEFKFWWKFVNRLWKNLFGRELIYQIFRTFGFLYVVWVEFGEMKMFENKF